MKVVQGGLLGGSGFFIPSLVSAKADPSVVFIFPTVRFSLLTPRMVRIEINPEGQFEDRPSQTFWHRRQPVPDARIQFGEKYLTIETDHLELTYRDSRKGFSSQNLKVKIKETDRLVRLDEVNPGCFPGTTRTLDGADGSVELQPGLVSRGGWVQLEDTASLVFNESGWLEPRPVRPGSRDVYLLVSGSDYIAALQDFQLISGKPSLFPRAFLGNWWSRYWEYSENDVHEVVEQFAREKIPLSVFILDMDWHVTQTGNACSGWTGFSWNRQLFPDPPGLIDWLHQKGMLTSLNLHPAEGIHSHEECYPLALQALGLDPQTNQPIPFELSDPYFMRVYFDVVLKPLRDDGVDFWWLDWQQGDQSALPGLDPLWWINHLHFHEMDGDDSKRPVIFSRWGGPGNQRYAIGFSGDTVVSWKSLAFQPFFTACAANAAYGWWSHDIGGHMYGREDRELYTRWVQFGVLSPIMRLHCTKNEFIERYPWAFDAEVLRLTREAMQLRHALVPYLYTMALRNEQEGLPLIIPLYYEWPKDDSASTATGQYLLGSQLMAAPVTEPLDPDLNQSRTAVWFPPGEWYDYFSGQRFSGPKWTIRYSTLSEIPLYARAGAIIPLQADPVRNGCSNPEGINLLVFPGADGNFSLYEDDGISQAYRQNISCRTTYSTHWDGVSWQVKIFPAVGDITLIPPVRSYRVLFRGIENPDALQVRLGGALVDAPTVYDRASCTLIVGPVIVSPGQGVEIEVFTNRQTLLCAEPALQDRLFRLLKLARMDTSSKWGLSGDRVDWQNNPKTLNYPQLNLTESQKIALLETLTGAGAIRLQHPQGGSVVVLVNPSQTAGFKCRTRQLVGIEPGGSVLKADFVSVDYFGVVKKIL